MNLTGVDRVTPGGTVQITVGAFSNSGKAFVTSFDHS
jgi:hypothetical protein